MLPLVQKSKNAVIFSLFAFSLGAIIGIFIWGFLALMNICTDIIWETFIPEGNAWWYYFAVCIAGGVFIGLCHKKWGDYPENMQKVMATVKKDKYYSYKNILPVALMAFLPLVFGGSIGPEAGLVGIIVGLCYWAGDKMKYAGQNMKELADVGISATVAGIFRSPFAGFLYPVEKNEGEGASFSLPKAVKAVAYLLAAFGAFGALVLFTSLFGGGMHIAAVPEASFGKQELVFFVPLLCVGIAAGMVFLSTEHFFEKLLSPLKKHPVINAVIGGAAIAVCGIFVPFSMFSGEAEMSELINTFGIYSGFALIGVGIIKLVLTNVCIASGWKGGHFFPVIFSGVSIGYGCALVFGTDPSLSVIVVSSALMGATMRKPFVSALLLLLCLPVTGIAFSLIAAFIGAKVPLPECIAPKTVKRQKKRA